jgi:hypothetical protein
MSFSLVGFSWRGDNFISSIASRRGSRTVSVDMVTNPPSLQTPSWTRAIQALSGETSIEIVSRSHSKSFASTTSFDNIKLVASNKIGRQIDPDALPFIINDFALLIGVAPQIARLPFSFAIASAS